jgi:hypothetical protein
MRLGLGVVAVAPTGTDTLLRTPSTHFLLVITAWAWAPCSMRVTVIQSLTGITPPAITDQKPSLRTMIDGIACNLYCKSNVVRTTEIS